MKRQLGKYKTSLYVHLFTALTAIGAFIQINIPVEPIPMHFTLQVFLCTAGRIFARGKTWQFKYRHLSDDWTLWCSDLRIRWRTILPVKTNFWIFARTFSLLQVLFGMLTDRFAPKRFLTYVFYFHGRALCDVLIRQPLFLLCQQLHRTHYRIVENCSDQLLPFNCSRRFCPVCAISNCCAAADHYYEKNFTLNPFRLRYHSSAFSLRNS